MSIIDKYNATVDAKRNELATFVSDSIARITLPATSDSLPTKGQPRTTASRTPSAVIIGGGVVLVAGLALSKSVLAVLGGLAALGGIAMQVSASKQSKARTTTPSAEPKYYQLTSRIYAQLSDIQKNLFNDWKDTVNDNKDKLKNEISTLSIDEDKKNEAIQSILTTSVIDIPMMTVSSELSAIERQESVEAYRQYLQTFRSRCLAAIDKAVEEQKTIYAKLDGIL